MLHAYSSFKAIVLLAGVAAASIGVTAAGAQIGLVPVGWKAFDDGSHDYTSGADLARRAGGQGFTGVTIRSNVANPGGEATIAQSIRADKYRGQRVRLSGFLKSTGLGPATYFWMRVDGGPGATSDFMQRRPIRGTSDWQKQELVLDVPASAIGITFGFLLNGGGQAWLDDVMLEVVGQDVTLTGQAGGFYGADSIPSTSRALTDQRKRQTVAYRLSPQRPVNLDFAALARK